MATFYFFLQPGFCAEFVRPDLPRRAGKAQLKASRARASPKKTATKAVVA